MACQSLYLHIPFCVQKCPYCDFYSLPAQEDLMERYVEKLLAALERLPFPMEPLETIYFGGGTPSALGAKRLNRILESIHRHISWKPQAEITVECNPALAMEEELRQLREGGANRISMGMQSVSDQQLRVLGRRHTARMTEEGVEAAQRAGFQRISLDLMLATPGQTLEDIHRAVDTCARLGVGHVSAYLLKIEPGTPFAQNHMETQCPDEDGQADFYLEAVEALAAAGFQQYEISNFQRWGQIAQHNWRYWDCQEYLGLGPAAHSFIQGQRRFFPRDLEGFLKASNPWHMLQEDGPGGSLEEYVMLRLRLSEGVRWDQLAQRYPQYDPAPLRRRAGELPSQLIVADQQSIRLTTQGFLVSNTVIGALLEAF